MTFLKKLFGRKPISSEATADVDASVGPGEKVSASEVDLPVDTAEISGEEIGNRISGLLGQAAEEGWHPVASIKIFCNQCDHPIRLDYDDPGGGGGIGFNIGDNFVSIKNPITCDKCRSTSFRILRGRRTFKDWFEDSLNKIPPTEDDPEIGFRSLETDEAVRSHRFKAADTIEQLWSSLSDHTDSMGSLKDNFSFNYITTTLGDQTHIHRVTGLSHQNSKANEFIVVIKDKKGRFWYRIDRN